MVFDLERTPPQARIMALFVSRNDDDTLTFPATSTPAPYDPSSNVDAFPRKGHCRSQQRVTSATG
ncbi:hypothetical protein E2C01_091104 [Portunus trituberculatus]|uniref:Uncharacterized protein n=1 Tax=Portunus trituberculatus TaxID=210409 RepID=A0A5B7JMN4_PORTR|nr:hypothetical protein [Portunus trituberculatus]